MLKHAYHSTYHQLSKKHLDRYVQDFAGKQNIHNLDTMTQVQVVVACIVGKQFLYRNLIA